MALHKSASHSAADIAAEALAETLRIRKKYQAERNAIQAQILEFGNTRPEPASAEPSFADRIRARLNGHSSMLADHHLPDGVRLGQLMNERAELDYILDRILSQDEVVKRATLKAQYDIAHAAEFDSADREVGEALLMLKAAAAKVIRQDVHSRNETGLARGRQLEWRLYPMFPQATGSIYDALECLVKTGAITRTQADKAEDALRSAIGW